MTTLRLPSTSPASKSGTILKWCRGVGSPVAAGDLLFVFENELNTVEATSATAGILQQILVEQGKDIAVDAPVAVLAESGASISSQPSPTGAKPTMTTPSAAMPASITPILMPQAGQSMEEGTIVKWRIAPGDTIKEGDIIFEVETDKAVVEVEATASGRLAKIVVPEGGVQQVKLPVAYIAVSDEELEAWLAQVGAAAPAAAPAATPAPAPPAAPALAAKKTPPPAPRPAAPAAKPQNGSATRVAISPAARRQAQAAGINPSALSSGSGPHGRILTSDVTAAQSRGAGSSAPIHVAPLPAVSAAMEESIRTPLAGMRKAIAKNLQASKQSIPHFYMRVTIDVDPLMAFYRAEKPRSGLSLNDLIIAACARIIQDFPAFRSRIEGDEIVELPHSSIGIAVGTDNGLTVPVVVGAEAYDFGQLAAETKRIVEAARNGKLEGFGQGVFTISNLGMFGVEEFSAIINPPEAAILAVSAAREEVIVRSGMMRPGRVMTMTLSADHRLIDGLLAAKFMARLKEVLENPQVMQ